MNCGASPVIYAEINRRCVDVIQESYTYKLYRQYAVIRDRDSKNISGYYNQEI